MIKKTLYLTFLTKHFPLSWLTEAKFAKGYIRQQVLNQELGFSRATKYEVEDLFIFKRNG